LYFLSYDQPSKKDQKKCGHVLKRLTAQENNDAITHWGTLFLQTHYIKNMAVVKKFCFEFGFYFIRKEAPSLVQFSGE